jgi:hypothetical protein
MKRTLIGALATVLFAAGCSVPSSSSGDPADVRGEWTFTAEQVSPALTLTGTLSITSQDGDLISGTLSWQESDGAGNTRVDGGPITGRVLGDEDVDFDLLRTGGSRRHVARLLADTMEGNWLQASIGASGEFRAVRDTP